MASNPLLLRLVKMTAEGLEVPELQTAAESARHRIAKQMKQILQPTQQDRDYILSVDTLHVRSCLRSCRETATAVFAVAGPRRDGVLFCMRLRRVLARKLPTTVRRSIRLLQSLLTLQIS